MNKILRFLSFLCGVAVLVLSLLCVSAQTTSPAVTTNPSAASKPAAKVVRLDRFESSINKFEKKDKESLPPPGGVLFVGSSTFTKWTELEEDLKEFHAINRGFGGSTAPEVLHYMDRIVFPYKPATIVTYFGTNDLAGGRSPQQLADDFKTFVERVQKRLPGVPIYCIPPNPAPAREKWVAEYAQAGTLLQEYIAKTPGLYFIDPRPLMKDAKGQHRMELYMSDKLHMNRQGYELWIPVIKKALQEKTSTTAPAPH